MDVWTRNSQSARAVMAALPAGGRILEVGSGPIGLRTFVDPTRYTVLRTDLRVRRWQSALGLGRGLVKASALSLPFGDSVFDAVVAVDVVEHIPRTVRATAFAEMRRVSKMFVILHCPVQSPDGEFTGEEDDQALAAWFQGRFGYDEPNTAEHLRARHPTLHELLSHFPGATITGTQPSAFWADVARESRVPVLGLAATLHHRQMPLPQPPYHALLLQWSVPRAEAPAPG